MIYYTYTDDNMTYYTNDHYMYITCVDYDYDYIDDCEMNDIMSTVYDHDDHDID